MRLPARRWLGAPEGGAQAQTEGVNRQYPRRAPHFELDDSPTFPKSWPTSVTYVDTTLEWDEATSRWTTSAPLLELSKQSTQWGDRSGGEKMVSTAAMAAGGGEEAGPGSGSTCLHGTWRTDTCNGAKTHTLSFTTANNGHYVMPDCNNVCTKPLDYHYDYSIAGSNVTLRHTGSSEILCNGSPATPPKPTSNDTFAFSCDTLTTTTSLGTKTFTRVK